MEQYFNLKSKIAPALREVFGKRMQDLLHKCISQQFINSESIPNRAKKLQNRSGQLLNSFKSGNENSIFDVSFTSGGIGINIGSKLPYAAIQEFGGSIPPSEKVAGFFWYKFYSTKDEYFKFVALRVMSGKELRIKKRPYLEPGIELFLKKYLPDLVDDLTKNIFK